MCGRQRDSALKKSMDKEKRRKVHFVFDPAPFSIHPNFLPNTVHQAFNERLEKRTNYRQRYRDTR